MSDPIGLVQILEAALLAAGKPLTVAQMGALFEDHERPSNDDIRAALAEVKERCEGRGYELVDVASGFRFQVRERLSPWVGRLWQERPQRYSRALLETLALIAYRQPITRGEIEEIRGVTVSRGTIDLLIEMDWIRFGRRRMTPGRPVTFVVTQNFLDHFGLESARDLPGLKELRSAGLLESRPPPDEPSPTDEDEDQTELFED